MSDLGTILKFVAVGYVALVVLAAVMGPFGPSPLVALFLLGAIAWVWWYAKGRTDRPRESPPTHTLPPAAAAKALPAPAPALAHAQEAARLDSLEAQLPEDPLDSPLLVELAPLYEHEPPEDVARLHDEYRAERARLEACRVALERGEPIGSELDRLEQYAEGLRATATAAGDDPLASALEATGRAREAVAQARSELDALGRAPEELAASLEDAEAALDAAESAFAAGHERPLVALARAGEAERTAGEVSRRAGRLRTLPDELDRRLEEFRRVAERADRELERVKEDFAAASGQYTPACWSDVRGVGAAAEQAAERAHRGEEAAARTAATDPAGANEELDAAFDALDRARSLTEKVATHLSRLEEASLTARDRLAAAARAVEEADVHGRSEDAVERAQAMVERAQEELERPQPEWLRITELADRAQALLEAGVAAQASKEALTAVLEDQRARAKETRDDAWAHGLVSEIDEDARPLLEHMEQVYREALETEASAPDGEDGLEATIEAYGLAERTARATGERIGLLYADSVTERVRKLREDAALDQAQVLVWGPGAVRRAFDESR